MKLKQISVWSRITIQVAAFAVLAVMLMPAQTAAQPSPECEGMNSADAIERCEQRLSRALDCSPERVQYRDTSTDRCDLYVKYINPIIRMLSALVGVAAVIGLVIGGIRYSSSGGDPGQAAAAKKQIRNVIIALLAYLFLLAGLNWLVPGGVYLV